MKRQEERLRLLAAGLSALAGFVDTIGFIKFKGAFVSFMSGNSTRLGVSAVQRSPDAVLLAGLIAMFVVGVIIGSITGHKTRLRRRSTLLLLVCTLLAVAATFNLMGHPLGAMAAMAMAMGAENTIFEHDGKIEIGLTYVTGTLVKIGQRIAAALLGGDALAWTPLFLFWLGLVSGGCAGAALYPLLGLNALWIAATAAALLAIAAAMTVPD